MIHYTHIYITNMNANIKKMNIKKVVADMVSALPERQKDVIMKRFGLKDGARRTLESIGQEYHITRERVRQIENDAKSSILKSKHINKLDAFFSAVVAHIDEHGGMRSEQQLLGNDLKMFFPASVSEKDGSSLMYFLLNIKSQFFKVNETPEITGIWATKKSTYPLAKKYIEALVKKMESHGRTVDKKDILNWLSEYTSSKEPKVLESYFACSKQIASNVYNDFGLKHWSEITTKGVRDKAYLILKKSGQPMHFRHVVSMINDKFNLSKKAHPQTVHNELIKDNKFILVGRGTYALSEWGFKPGTVADVLKRVLQDSNIPMTREEILQAVLKERNVKASTVMLNLQNTSTFEKMEDGRFVLRQAV